MNRRIKVLIACDDEGISLRLLEMMERSGIGSESVKVLNVSETIDRAIQYSPEFVVLVFPPNAEVGLRTMREILEMVPTRIVVVGPAADPQLILQTLREGAYQYVDISEFDSELNAVIARLRSEPPLQYERGRIIAVLGTTGGCGTSTLAVNLSSVLASSAEKCALFDLNLVLCQYKEQG